MEDNRKLGYIHAKYEEVAEHTAESVWQECMCRSCQDMRELRGYTRGTAFRHKDEKY